MSTPRISLKRLALLSAVALATVGCHRQEATAETTNTPLTASTQSAVNNYAANPTDANKAKTDAAFETLNASMADLQAKIDAETGPQKETDQAKLDGLKNRRDDLRKNYDQAKFDQLKSDTSDFFSRAGQSIENGANAVGDAAKDAGNKVKDAVQ